MLCPWHLVPPTGEHTHAPAWQTVPPGHAVASYPFPIALHVAIDAMSWHITMPGVHIVTLVLELEVVLALVELPPVPDPPLLVLPPPAPDPPLPPPVPDAPVPVFEEPHPSTTAKPDQARPRCSHGGMVQVKTARREVPIVCRWER